MYENNRNRKPLQLHPSKSPLQQQPLILKSKKSQHSPSLTPTQSYLSPPSQPSQYNQSFIDMPITHSNNNMNSNNNNNMNSNSNNGTGNNNNNKYQYRDDFNMNSPSQISSSRSKNNSNGDKQQVQCIYRDQQQQIRQLNQQFQTVIANLHNIHNNNNNNNINKSRSLRKGINKNRNIDNNTNNNGDDADIYSIVGGMHRIYTKCIQKNISFNTNTNAVKLRQKSTHNQQNIGIQWITLLINATLNIWKILSQCKCNPNIDIQNINKSIKYLSILQIISKTCTKIMNLLNININVNNINNINNNNNISYQWQLCSNLLDNQIKNRLILLMIIWAQEQLDTGNIQQSLKICNICSYELIRVLTTNNNNNNKQNQNKSKFNISKENKFKLHFLRMKIFKQLGKQKEEIQEIIVCEELLKNMNEISSSSNKDKKNNVMLQLSQLKQNRNNSIANPQKSNILLKLQNRKQQLLKNNQNQSRQQSPSSTNNNINYNKMNKNMSEHQNQSKLGLAKFKQIRDSLLMNSNTDDDFGNSTAPMHSFGLKRSQSLKRVQSVHQSNVNSRKVNFNSYNNNTNQLPNIYSIQEPDETELMMKSTVKQKFQSLHNQGQYSGQNYSSTVNKFGNKSRLKINQTKNTQQVRSVSAYKTTIKTKIQDKNKIKQKYELKPKKLTKRAIITASKNNQFDIALQDLDEDCAMQQNCLQQLKHSNHKNISSYLQSSYLSPVQNPLSTYMQLLLKRPQQKSLKKSQNIVNNIDSLLTNQNMKSSQNNGNHQLQNSINNNNKNNLLQQISDKIAQDCVDKVQKQIIQRYITRLNNIKKKAVLLQNRDIQDFRSQQQIQLQDSQNGMFQSQSNQTIIAESAMKIKQINEYPDNKQSQHKFQYNKIQDQYLVQQSDVYNNYIPDIIFPGLGLCSIKINIKKVKQLSAADLVLVSLERKEKLSCIMSLSIQTQFGSFLSVHRMPQYLMPSNLTIAESINQKMQGENWVIRVGNYIMEEDKLDDLLQNKKVIGYIKKNLHLVNRGLGLKLQTKKQKQDPMKLSTQPTRPFPQYQSIIALSRVSRIYLQNKNTISCLFSGQCKQTIQRGQINDIFKSIADSKHAHDYDYKNNLMETLKQNKAQKSSKNFNIMDMLAVIYITIQKKSKNQNKMKKAKSNKLIKKVESGQKLHLSCDGSQQKQVFNQHQPIKQHKVGFKNTQIQSKQKCQILQSLIFKKPSQNQLSSSVNNSNSNNNNNNSSSIDTLLIPVIKYVLMGQTSKPKHKLKTIIVKGNQNHDGNQFSDDQMQEQKNQRSNKNKSNNSKKYGLLTPYIDDKLTVKTKSISTGIYEQIIGEYFMNYRNKQQIISSKQALIPQDVMLSLKYYLMISTKSSNISPKNPSSLPLSISKRNQQQQIKDDTMSLATACTYSSLQSVNKTNKINDVMNKFYNCFEYQFVIKLHNQNMHERANNYHIRIKIYWAKELYRAGLEKFYILQFQVKERSARSRIDKFVLTSYDIEKHFADLVFDPNSNGRSHKNIQQNKTKQEIIQNKQAREVKQYHKNYPKTARTLKMLQPLASLQSQRKRSSRKDISKQDQSIADSSNNNNQDDENKQQDMQYNDDNSIQDSNRNRLGNNFQLLAPGIQQKQARSQALSDAKSESQARVQSQIHLDYHYVTDQNIFLKLLTKNENNMLNINSCRNSMNLSMKNSNSLFMDEKKSNIKIFSASNKDLIQEYSQNNQTQNQQFTASNMFLNTDPIVNREKQMHVFSNSNSNLLEVSTVNRLSCPQKQFKQRLEFNRSRRLFEIQNPVQSAKSLNNSILFQDHNKNNNMSKKIKQSQSFPCQKLQQNQTQSLIAVDTQVNIDTEYNKSTQNNNNHQFNRNNKFFVKLPIHLSCFKPTPNQSSSQILKKANTPKLPVSQFLKAIAQRITVYKTKIYTKLGLRSSSSGLQQQTPKKAIQQKQKTYFANKFRFSRTNNDRLFAQQFLTPHLNNLQIIFQKIIKIKCDGLYVIMTIVKVQACDQFYINMYVSQMQNNLLFTVTCQVFQYFDQEDLIQIFDPYLNLKLLSNHQIYQKITQFFTKPINTSSESNSNSSCNRNSVKVIWSRILKHLTFERRPFAKWNKNSSLEPQARIRDSYLIAKLGAYQAFVKNFVVDDFIQVKNQIRASQHCSYQQDSIVRVQVSMQPKLSGLNFSTPKTKISKRSQIRSSQKSSQYNPSFSNPMSQSQSLNIYESQTNKYIVYVTISSTSAPQSQPQSHCHPSNNCQSSYSSANENHQKICYSYYLCQLLHLIDYDKTKNNNNNSNSNNNNGEQKQMKANVDSVYHTQSKQFREIILNYAVLFKVLNYIKNQYIIQLQNQTTYLPKLYKDSNVKQLLKKNVNKILLRKDRKSSILQQVNQNNNQNDKIDSQDATRNFLLELLSISLKPNTDKQNKNSINESNSDKDIIKHSSKITFNSKIITQPPLSPIYFLLRKVVSRKGYPISCLFFDQNKNCLRLYLSDYRKARIKQIMMPIQSHSMMYIDVIMNAYACEGYRQVGQPSTRDYYHQDSAYNPNGTGNGLLFFRNRLRKFYRNITLLTHI